MNTKMVWFAACALLALGVLGCGVQADPASDGGSGDGTPATMTPSDPNATASSGSTANGGDPSSTANGGDPNATSDSTSGASNGDQGQAQGQTTVVNNTVIVVTPPPAGQSADGGTTPPPAPSCGDGICNGNESHDSCPQDCPAPAPTCGDGECNGDEDYYTCPTDCPSPAPAGWTCEPFYYADGECDCGCGIPDPDCDGNGCTGVGCQAAFCDYCYDPATGGSPPCNAPPPPPAATYLPDVVRSPAPGVIEYHSLYVSDASCGLVYGDLPGIGWNQGTIIRDTNGDGYLTHTMTDQSRGYLVSGMRYESAFQGVDSCTTFNPKGTAEFGSHCVLSHMRPEALKYVYCEGFDPSAASCWTKKSCGIFVTADANKKLGPLGVPSFTRTKSDGTVQFFGSPGYITDWNNVTCDWSRCMSQ